MPQLLARDFAQQEAMNLDTQVVARHVPRQRLTIRTANLAALSQVRLTMALYVHELFDEPFLIITRTTSRWLFPGPRIGKVKNNLACGVSGTASISAEPLSFAPSRHHICTTAQDDNMQMIMEHREHRAIDPEDTCKKLPPITNPTARMFKGLSRKAVFPRTSSP